MYVLLFRYSMQYSGSAGIVLACNIVRDKFIKKTILCLARLERYFINYSSDAYGKEKDTSV